MDNCSNSSMNYTCPPSIVSFVVFNVVMLLGVVLPVIAVNTAILVALVLESSIVKVVRLVLGSILVSCLLVALGMAMFHFSGTVLSLSPVNNPPDLPCTITTFLIGFGGAARLVFMATFAVMVYIIVKYGKATNKRLFFAVLVAVVAQWVIAFLAMSPVFSPAVASVGNIDSLTCTITVMNETSNILVGVYAFFFGLVTFTVTITFLISVCLAKRRTNSASAVEKTLVKFGFFLLFTGGLNLLGYIAPVFIGFFQNTLSTVYIGNTLLNTALIPTPILFLIFFKSIRKRLWNWLCCCMAKRRKAKHNHNNNNNMEGRMVTTGV